MNRNKLKFFLAPDDGGDAGGSATDVLDPPDLQQAAADPVQTDPPDDDPVVAPVVPAFDQAAFAAAIAEGIRQGTPPPAVQQQRQYTAEEAKKLLNVWEPTPEWLQRFDNQDTRLAAIAEQRDAMLRQFDTVTQMRMQERDAQWEQRVAPMQQYITQQDAVARESRFAGAYPQLSDPAFKPIVNATIGALAQSGALRGKDEASAFKLIAGSVEAFAKQTNPAFKLTPAGSTPSGKQQNNGNALKPQSSGSGGGGGGKGNADAGTGKALALKFL